jgi:serine/threonine protein kinase
MMPMQLRQFELRSKIGSGGMGTVYRAWDTTL